MSISVLVINCGSSSIKYALVSKDSDQRIEGLAENLGTPQARIKGTTLGDEKFLIDIANADHAKALETVLDRLSKLPSHLQPKAIGHRVVHGGEKFTKAKRISADIIQAIKDTSALAPLHNPANLIGIEATLKLFPDLPQVAVFDTAFHQTMPPQAYRYALPQALYDEHGVRRYGFHGTSHAYVSERASTLAGHPNQGGWISAHLGNGCSTCAIWNGKSMDTSMGLTPLEGVVMGTRSGDIDPGLHRFLADNLGWSLLEIDRVLNRDSGLLGLSGLSNDMRTLVEAADAGNANAQLAIDVFCYRLAKSIAAMSCALPQFNGLIFTGGIGENAAVIREQTLAALPHFGLQLDQAKNQLMVRGAEGRIDNDSNPQIWVIPTDEEGRIAEETCQVLNRN